MATFKACVLKPRKDGMYNVYIRVTHNRKIGYINTQKIIDKKGIKKDGSIKDPYVLNFCSSQMKEYADKMNSVNASNWDLKRVLSLLETKDSNLCFSDYARKFIQDMINNNKERSSRNYSAALRSLELKLGTKQIMFDMLTSHVIKDWIKSLGVTRRAKEMYPVNIRHIFNTALKEFNDYDTGNLVIKHNPWMIVDIPQSDKTDQRAISPEECRKFFYAPLPKFKRVSLLPKFGRDIAQLVLCLAGMNTVDLYNLQKSDVHGNIIGYKRAKTKGKRSDEAYIEIKIEPIIQDLINEYLAPEDDPYFFNFHCKYATSDSFSGSATRGIKQLCEHVGLPDAEGYCVYTFRHTWATVAQNDCDASIDEVALGMNHTRNRAVTRGYIKMDFTPVWELNAKVIDFIFFSDKKSKQGQAKGDDKSNGTSFRISSRSNVCARAYYQGKIIAEINGKGYGTVDNVIKALLPSLPNDMPEGATVQFRIKNVDKDTEAVYSRTKGKGF